MRSFLYCGDYFVPEPDVFCENKKNTETSTQQQVLELLRVRPVVARDEPTLCAGAEADGHSMCSDDTAEFLTQASYLSVGGGSQSSGMSLGAAENQKLPSDYPYSLDQFSIRLERLQHRPNKRKRNDDGSFLDYTYIQSCNIKNYAINCFKGIWPQHCYFSDSTWQPASVRHPARSSRRAELIFHVHVYVMAGSYGIEGLLHMALYRLKATLQVYEVCAERLSDLLDLVGPLYRGTTAPDPGRTILSEYCGVISEDIWMNQVFAEARRSYPEFDSDFCAAKHRQSPRAPPKREVDISRAPRPSPKGFDLAAALETR
ncbi:hypothetical protein FALBO_16086 [Fusarium albosuccineum]|uniref:Uncharacterized protein n=1 Tax=Fusarium albosuccineum TaxID=1237068 RepID=A0A8H4NYY3_9HYPO|nr:hypothetical protein FALBO_16086 [Fusarium albosuccineum]